MNVWCASRTFSTMNETESNLPIELEAALRTVSDDRVIASFSEALNAHAKRQEHAAKLEHARILSSQSLQWAFSMKKYILTTIITAIMIGQAYFFGVSDFVVLGFVAITAIFIYISLIKLYEGNRKMLRVYSRSGSVLHAFLSRDRTFLMRVVALFSSLTLSSILVFLLKGMVLQQGYFAFFIVIVAASLILYSFVNDLLAPAVVNDNLHQDISAHGNEVLRIFYAAIILNLILALAFSAHDTFAFKTSDVDFSNFTDKAVEKSFEKTDANHYSRIFINAYLLMDYAKVAMPLKVTKSDLAHALDCLGLT
jgi:hypothetical protein